MRQSEQAEASGRRDGLEAFKFEVNLIHSDTRAYIRSSIPFLCLFLGLSFVPQFAHLRACCFASAALVAGNLYHYSTLVDINDHVELRRQSQLCGNIGHLFRTLGHLLWITFHNESTFTRLLYVYVIPVASARQSHSLASYRVYILAHLALTVYRFRADFEAGAPWIIAALLSALHLVDVAASKEAGKRARVQLNEAHVATVSLAETTITSLMSGFCDAFVTLGPDLRLREASKSLAALLGRKAEAGKDFMDMIDMGDRDYVREQLAGGELLRSVQGRTADGRHTMRSQSIKVDLQDSFNVQVSVHLFHAYLETRGELTHFIGVCEAWQPKEAECRNRRRHARKAPSAARELNVTTGRLESTSPAFPSGGTGLDVKWSAETCRLEENFAKSSLARRRPSSPRP